MEVEWIVETVKEMRDDGVEGGFEFEIEGAQNELEAMMVAEAIMAEVEGLKGLETGFDPDSGTIIIRGEFGNG